MIDPFNFIPLAGPILTSLIKAFDDRTREPERVRHISEKNFRAGQDNLRRIRETEASIRSAEGDPKESEYLHLCPRDGDAPVSRGCGRPQKGRAGLGSLLLRYLRR